MKKTSKKGIDFIKSFEGCILHAYKPVKTEEYYTIGFGHYGSDVQEGMKITLQQAENYLKQDLVRFENAINNSVKVPLNQNQFDALVSFTYNCGIGALQTSTLLKLLNRKDYIGAANQFLVWNKDSSNKVSDGLLRRRNQEKAMFLLSSSNINCALPYEVETTTDLNIRNGAGTSFNIIGLAKARTILKVWAIKTVGTAKWAKNEVGYFNLAYTKVI